METQGSLSVLDIPSLKLHLKRAEYEGASEFTYATHAGNKVQFYTPYAKYPLQYLQTLEQKQTQK